MVLRGIFGHRPAYLLAISCGQSEVMQDSNAIRILYMRVSHGTASKRYGAVCFQTAYRELASIACRQRGKTLFLITHSATDEEYTDNLKFLIKHGMGGSDKDLREYIIIIQQANPSCLPSHHLRCFTRKAGGGLADPSSSHNLCTIRQRTQ